VLVATDVASKGLDFNQIRHVINFDMPEARGILLQGL
jgi:ATP-dependent RNA helicase DDX41